MSAESNPTHQPDLTSFDVAQGAPAGAPACTSCAREIRDVYHEANGAIICSPCRARLQLELHGGSGAARFGRALGFGLVGAAIGSAMWFAVLALFEIELGLLAIVVGFLVGKGVHMGARGRGGWPYQTLAIGLTYSAIVVTYIPFILQGMAEGGFDPSSIADSLAVAAAASGDSLALAGDPAIAGAALDSTTAVQSLGAAGVLIGFLLLFVLAAASPILAGVENIIGLLIIGFALYQAWSMNKRTQIALTGPYRVGVPRDGGEPAAA